ncbi:MAG: hypothetical protein IJQ34_02195 [Kiritimatiellae bacterium]|nr:hypothetical protein [Kiritimatiellia bacterium]
MSKSTHQISIKGVDKTGSAFSSIQARATATSAQIRRAMGGALAAVGAYLSFRSITSAINRLGSLSDQAMKAGVSVDQLTKASLAFRVAGLNLSVETLIKSFQYLQKNTGRGGLDNFFKVSGEIAKIEDPAKRGAELVKNFGRAGLELQPLIANGEDAIDKMKTLAEIMPGVSQAAADAGDAAADSLSVFGSGAQSMMLKAVGQICNLWGDEFPGGVRAGALNAVNYLEYSLKRMWNYAVEYGAKIGLAMEAMWNWATTDASWDDVWADFGAANLALENDMENKFKSIEKARADYVEKLSKLSIDDLAGAFSPKRSENSENVEIDSTSQKTKTPRLQNQLVFAGSNQERRLVAFGRDQLEAKKHTELLQEIAENTEKTAEEVADSSATIYPETDLGV